MASFTDKILTFNPYVQEVPVDDYVRVGMWKQQQYDQGVQKVQSYIDSVAGIEVAKDVHKQYLNQTLENLKGSIGKVLSADFSNNQIVNQIGGLTGRLQKDPVLQNAMISTAAYKKGMAEMEKARSEGKSGVENDYAFQSQAQAWLTDKDAQSSFNGRYTPYRDVRKKMLDIIKEVGVDSNLTQIPFRRNGDGSVMLDDKGYPIVDAAMVESSTEGKNAEKLKRAIQLGLDESDINQLNIEAQYHFRGMDAQGMKKLTDGSYQARLENINTRLADLQTKKMTNINDPAFQAKIDEELALTKKSSEGLVKNYTRDMEHLNSNPESYKGSFYTQNFLDQVGDTFSTSKNSFKYMDNPYQKQLNDKRDYDLRWKEFENKVDFQNKSLQLRAMELEVSREKAAKDPKDPKVAQGLITEPITGATPTEDLPGTADFKGEIDATQNYLNDSKTQTMGKLFPTVSPAMREVKLLELKDAYDKGQVVTPIAAEYFRNTARVELDLENRKHALVEAERAAPSIQQYTKSITGMKAGPNNSYVYYPDQMISFNEKFGTLIPKPTIGGEMGSYSANNKIPDSAGNIFKTDKEKYLFNIRKKWYNGESMTPQEQMVAAKMNDVQVKGNNPYGGFVKDRDNIINKNIQEITKMYQPERYGIDAGNGEKREAVKNLAARVLQNAEERKKSVGESPNFDYDDAVKLNGDAGTSYGIYKKGNTAYITVGGEGVKTQYLPVSIQDLNRIYGNAFNREFDPIEQTLALTGGRTTNVQGRGPETAYFQKADFPNVSQYGVRADIQKGMSGYQLELHIYDPATKQWVSRTPFMGTQQEMLDKVRSLGDQTVKDLLALPQQK